MKKLLCISALVVAATIAARPAAATIAPGTPIARCLIAGDFSACPASSGRLSAFGSFASYLGAGIPGGGFGDLSLGSFLPSAGAIGGGPFGAGESAVFLSTFGTLGTIIATDRRHHPAHEEGWSDPPASEPLSVTNPEPAALFLTATGLLAIAALDLKRRARKCRGGARP